jgi:nucleotide-binding universal stress UspA family protein
MTLKLLLGFDGKGTARQALAYIAPLAGDPSVELTLLTSARASAVTTRLFDEAARLLGTAEFEHVAATGSLYGALLQAARARPYDLVVFGRGGSRWSRFARWRKRPSLSAALPASSLLVQGQARGISRALICAGGDETVVADARFTARLARRTRAQATILHVLSQVPLVFGRGAARERITEAFAATGSPEIRHMQAAVAELDAAGVDATIKVRVGLVVEEIKAELAEGNYDLLVIGAHRSQGLVERLLLEDVAAEIVPQSPVPVLVVKSARRAEPRP